MALADLIPQRYRAPALSAAELARAQELASVVFPPDLCELLLATLPTGPQFPDWRTQPRESLRRFRERTIEGIVFDVLHGSVWLGSWGERPANDSEIPEFVARRVRSAPDLIPIYGHRGIPNEPLEAGNPVFSVMQADVVVYGSDLGDYLVREFGQTARSGPPGAGRPVRFWTELLEARD